MVLERILSSLVKTGDLTVTDWNGRVCQYGDGKHPKSHIKFASASAARRMAIDPDMYIGESYMDGSLMIVSGSISDFLHIAMQNVGTDNYHPMHRALDRARMALRRIHQHNPVGKAKDNVAHHYDLSGAIYDLFLDRDRQYSCAYFESKNSTLEDAQLAKKRHIAAKLDIKPGMKVLDIGSGWGGLGLYLAEVCEAEVTGVTLSEEQFKLSNERAQQRGIKGHTQFLLKDYRELEGQFDRIVSVGMFEHVGVGHFPEFFGKVTTLLKGDGAAVLHSINRSNGPGATSAWIKKYIFPGGYVPALSEVLPHIEQAGLYVTDIEVLRLHYAETLKEWGHRFETNRAKAAEIYDERFCRMWEFYLAASEMAFRFSGMNNFQIQFSKDQNVLPLTRDYIHEQENRLRKIEGKTPVLKMVGKA
jgi:cyclopropane-fatty-acyl-phospholipid synthase